MALSHAILATLLSGPVSGYKLTKRFNAAIGYFWQATHQQIYRELISLEEHGYIERVPSSSPSTEKLYTLTPHGRNALVEWIMQPSEPGVLREDLLLKVRAGSLVPREVLLTELRRRRRHLVRLHLTISRMSEGNQQPGFKGCIPTLSGFPHKRKAHLERSSRLKKFPKKHLLARRPLYVVSHTGMSF